VGSTDNKLYAINPDGTLKWSYATGNDVYYSSPALTTLVCSATGKSEATVAKI